MNRFIRFAAVAAALMLMLVAPVAAQDTDASVSVQAWGGYATGADDLAIAVGAAVDFGGLTVSIDTDPRDASTVTMGFAQAVGVWDAAFFVGLGFETSTTDVGTDNERMHASNTLGALQVGVGVSRSLYAVRWLTDGDAHVVQAGLRWAFLR